MSQFIRPIGPEDLEPRMYVSEYERSLQYVCTCSEPHHEPRVQSVRVRAWNAEPLEVRAVCLPYVFVRSPDRAYKTIDTREVTLVRVPDQYARTVVDAARKKKKKKKKKKRKKLRKRKNR